MKLLTSFHGAWAVTHYDEITGAIDISKDGIFLQTTINALVDAEWQPRLVHTGNATL